MTAREEIIQKAEEEMFAALDDEMKRAEEYCAAEGEVNSMTAKINWVRALSGLSLAVFQYREVKRGA